MPDSSVLDRAAACLAEARRALFVTGAGLSADSGLPTYRGVGGLYDGGATEDGVPIEVALSGPMFRRDPALSWKYIAQIEAACRGARPNRGHEVLAQLQDRLDAVVLTQNVDGFHTEAGSRQVIEIHGNLRRLKCTRCTWSERVADYRGLQIPPACPRCERLVRPDVVLFGEMLPHAEVAALQTALLRGFDLVCSIGTTSAFPYIAEPVVAAARAGLPSIEINPGESEVSHLVTHRLSMGAAEALEALADRL